MKNEKMNETNKQNINYEYSSYLLNLNIKCDYLKVNKKLEYELSTECVNCQSILICQKYIYLQNMKSTVKQRTEQRTDLSNEHLNETLKLNCDYVELTRKRRRLSNKFKNIDLNKVPKLVFEL